jgi:hypothetical protein
MNYGLGIVATVITLVGVHGVGPENFLSKICIYYQKAREFFFFSKSEVT